jgi:hypothetical protein
MPAKQMESRITNSRLKFAAERAAELSLPRGSFRYDAREVVGVFDSEGSFEEVIDELLVRGFDRSQLSVLASRSQFETSIRALEDDPATLLGGYMSSSSRTELEAAAVGFPMLIAGVGSYIVVMIGTGGTLAFALSALLLAGAAGGGTGWLLAHTIARRHRDAIAKQLAAGGLVVWVSVREPDQESTALEVLKFCGGHDVHVHQVEREWGLKDVPFYDVQPDPFLENEHRDEL